MKKNSTILEAIEQKIEGINLGSAVTLSDIIGNHKEPEIIAATKMLLRKYGIELKENYNDALRNRSGNP